MKFVEISCSSRPKIKFNEETVNAKCYEIFKSEYETRRDRAILRTEQEALVASISACILLVLMWS